MTAVGDSGFPRRGHPHNGAGYVRCRGFASRGTVNQVQRMLGHSSVVTTETHHMPFIRARQQQLADSFRRMWPVEATAAASATA